MKRYSSTKLPTRWGDFDAIVYRGEDGQEHMAIALGLDEARDAKNKQSTPLVRIHSACFTSEALGSLKCDCREQLDAALRRVQSEGRGVVIYLFQEGRGIGLGAKIQAYSLQERGLDTVDANLELGHVEDARTYEPALAILRDLKLEEVRLLTNNPLKVNALIAGGLTRVERVELEVGLNEINQSYLETKRDRMGHMLKLKGD